MKGGAGMVRRKKRSLIFAIMRMSVLPIAILGIIMTAYGQNSVKEGMIFEIQYFQLQKPQIKPKAARTPSVSCD